MALPACPLGPPLAGYVEHPRALIKSSQPDMGKVMTRRRGALGSVFENLRHSCTAAEVATWEAFVEATIKQVNRFTYPHPRTGATLEVVLQDQGDRRFAIQEVGPNHFYISFTLEVVP